ncbi:putative carboxylesterase, type B, carboxylesterase type B, carboxylesterase type B, active [Septoria linicola]|nr:putative carboxylesterase, type B, carboxylesterase type B, carboxylesterase type B, active [Septoria linicola]
MAAGIWNGLGGGALGTYTNGIGELGSPFGISELLQQITQGFSASPGMSLLTGLCSIAGLCGALQSLAPGVSNPAELPTVDLDYVLQKPTFLNTQYDVYVFSDIRYAAPPVGNNRFRAPQAPVKDRSTVQSGGEQRACAQAAPKWQATTNQFVPRYEAGQTQFDPASFPAGAVNTSPSSRETEDCLFLDVYTPRAIFAAADKGPGAPVVVQIHGGGFVSGAKDLNPAGLIERDRDTGGNGTVIVSLNYRLGAFGWLAGSAVQQDGNANAGLLDQQFALNWVKQHAKQFGGDPNRISVIGESAGAASILHQITSNGGGQGVLAFQKAIIQSPAFFPVDDTSQTDTTARNLLRYLGVSSLSDARKTSFNAMYAANAQQVGDSPYGLFTYGPAVDGSFVPNLPGRLLAKGQFHKDVNLIVGHNANEGIGFTSPFIRDDVSFAQYIGGRMSPSKATTSNLQYIANTLYPPVFDGSQGYTNQIGRTSRAVAEMIFTCNTFYLDTAFNNQTFAYQFAVPPAYHGSDLPYTYYTGTSANPDPQVQVAVAMQKYFLNFAKTGDPNGNGLSKFQRFGGDANMQVFRTSGFSTAPDDTANARCRWWQTNL